MTRRLNSLMLLVMLAAVAAGAFAWSPPADLSLRGIVDWVAAHGHISRGATPPAVASEGTRFLVTSPDAGRPVEKQRIGAAWVPLWTWDHNRLTNLPFALSGHGIVPVTHGGTGGTTDQAARINLGVYSIASTDAEIASNVGDLSGVTQVASARDHLDVYSVEETDLLIAQTVALLRFYVSPEPSADIASYGLLSDVATETAASFTTGPLTDTLTMVTQRITASGSPNITQTPAGIYPFSIAFQRTGTKNAYFQVRLYKRDLSGTEVGIATSAIYTVTDEAFHTVTLDTAALSTVAWASTDRLVLRTYASKETTGASVALTFFYGDGYQSYITLSAGGGGVYARQDLSNVDPAKGRIALGFPDPTGAAGLVLTVGTDSSTLYWSSAGSGVHSALTGLDFASSGHTGFASAGDVLALWASVTAELDPMNYQENYDIMASASALVIPLSGRTYVGIQNIDELKSIHINPGGTVASDGPANLILYAGEVWYQRLADSAPVAFYASEATPIVIFQGK